MADIPPLAYLPVFDGARFRGEAGSDSIYLPFVGGIFPSIAFILDLLQGFGSRSVELELEDIDIVGCFHDTVYPSLTLWLLHIDCIYADQSQDEIERVLEVTLPFLLVLLAPHGVGDARQEGGE